MPEPQPFFIAGLGRSGTTALTEVLASHPEIVLGIERYKKLWGRKRIHELDDDRFTRDRFFDFSDGLTNITPEANPARWGEHYDRMAEKWDRAAYVGDKLTVLPLGALWKNMPSARILCIVRDIREVASSWELRATNENDRGWAKRNDARESVRIWNDGNRRILRGVVNRPKQTGLVEYRSFFGDPEATALRGVLDWLGLQTSPEIEKEFADAHQRYVDVIADKDRPLPAEASEFIAETADEPLFTFLTSRAFGAKR